MDALTHKSSPIETFGLCCVIVGRHNQARVCLCLQVQMDVVCSDLNLRSAPTDLPPGVQMLDLSRNQVQNLTQETLAYRSDFHHLNLHSNRIHFIQPDLFREMSDLRVLDLSKNYLNVFALSKINIGSLTAVESLDLSSNGLYTGMSDFFLADSPVLTNLSLNSNSITKIAQNAFGGTPSLRKINLHNNIILEIEDGAFDSLYNLTELDLSKNSVTCITDFNLYNLKMLNLSKNSVELFQSSSPDRRFNLLQLDLSENKMLSFPSLPRANVLKYLDVSHNLLQSVNVSGSPETGTEICLYFLQYLDMSFNHLKTIPESFFYFMKSLKVLNVSNNCISSFSVTGRGLLSSVKVINLSYNSLQSLTFREDALQSLEKLYLQGNDLTTLDHQIFQRLPSMMYLDLQQNNLQICGSKENHYESSLTRQNQVDPSGCVSFTSVPNLQFLYFSENNLQTLPENAFANTPLKSLDLSLNPGLEIHKDALSGLERSLVQLILRENNMSRLNTDLSLIRSLKHVDLSTNQLNSLPPWNKESSIESLNLQNNNLVTLEYSTMVALEHSLKTLYMGSNPLSCCSNLGFLRMVQRSAVVVPDIETVTCVHKDFSKPVNIEKLTDEMCQESVYVIIFCVLAVIVALAVLGLLLKCCLSRKRKRNRGYTA